MIIAIANCVGGQKSGIKKEQKIVDAFKTRVLADGGTFEAESCLITQIQGLL
jgi:hypothetical protein